jgi:hypothetical protein
MATTLAWGENALVTMSLGFLVNQFTLDDAIYGQLDGVGVLDGNLEGIDVTEYVKSVQLRRGRSSSLDNFEAGSATIVLNNNDRRFDPINDASPYWDVVTNESGVQPRRQVTVSLAGELVFVGSITTINIAYNQDLSDAIIGASDDFVLLANQSVTTTFTPPVEVSGTRITSILDLPEIDYSIDHRSIATGGKDLQALAIDAGTNALQYMQACAEADQALLFVSRDGTLTYTDPVSTIWNYDVAADFVDANEPITAGVVPYTGINTITDQTFLYNKVVVAKEGGTEYISNDIASQDSYGISTLTLTGLLLENDTDAAALSAQLLDAYKDPVYRFDDMQFVVNGLGSNSRTTLNQLEIGDGIKIVRTFATGSPLTVERYYQVDRLEHSITPSQHQVTIGLGDLKTVIYPFILDDTTFGTLDSTNALS